MAVEHGNGIDDNCDGDVDQGGWHDACDGVDDNCNGRIDEHFAGQPPCFCKDQDGDGVPNCAVRYATAEEAPPGWARETGIAGIACNDCDDTDSAVGCERGVACP